MLMATGLQFVGSGKAFSSNAGEAPPDSSPLALYGRELRFDILRDGKEVGWHKVIFEESGPILTVYSNSFISIDFLFLTVFRFEYRSFETWQDGHLEGVVVEVDDAGEMFSLDAERKGGDVKVRTTNGDYTLDMSIYPTNHWNAGVLRTDRVLNTLTGRVNRVSIEPAGQEYVETERRSVLATRYIYSGDLETEVWYDYEGRWVKMRFDGRDGSTIEYACRRCQGGNATEAQR